MKRNPSRREFLAGAAAIGASAATAMTASAQIKNEPWSGQSFVDQYYEGMLKIAKDIRATQIGNISKAMTTAYERIQKGGKAHAQFQTGHYVMFAASSDVPGQPNILQNTRGVKNDINTGDFLLGMRGNQDLRDKGVYVVGVTNGYGVFAKTPPGGLNSSGSKMEDSCDLVIDSQMPWYNGLVNVPWIPTFHVMPSCGNAMMLVYWPCTAVLANLIGTKGKGSSTEPAERYLDLAIERIQMIGTDRPKMSEVTSKWADLVLNEKARFLVYGHPQEGTPYQGTKNMYVNEAYIVADGTAIADLYEGKENDLRKSDIVLIGAFTSDNADEINVARNSKKFGSYTTAFCPYSTDGNSLGARLFKEVDSSFYTYSDESAGVLSIPGYKEKICPLAPLMGNVVHWMLMSSWCDNMYSRGKMPHFWQGFGQAGSKESNPKMEEEFKKLGY